MAIYESNTDKQRRIAKANEALVIVNASAIDVLEAESAVITEGFWTPTCPNTLGAGCRYIKIGNQVTCLGLITLSAGGSSGINFGGLPFVQGSSSGKSAKGVVALQNVEVGEVWSAIGDPNTSDFHFVLGNNYKEITASNSAYFEFTYFID